MKRTFQEGGFENGNEKTTDISSNALEQKTYKGKDSWNQINDDLKSMTSLKSIILRAGEHVVIEGEDIAPFKDALQSNSTLSEFALVGHFVLKSEAARYLGEALRLNSTLTKLTFNIDFDSDLFSALFLAISGNQSLKTLSLSYAGISEFYPSTKKVSQGFKDFISFISSHTSLRTIDLSDTEIGPVGGKLVSEAFKNRTSLEKIKFACTGISDDGVVSFVDALMKKKIGVLDLCQVNMTDVGAQSIAELIKCNDTISELWLSDDGIGLPGIISIFTAAKCSTSITRFEFVYQEEYIESLIQYERDLAFNNPILLKANFEDEQALEYIALRKAGINSVDKVLSDKVGKIDLQSFAFKYLSNSSVETMRIGFDYVNEVKEIIMCCPEVPTEVIAVLLQHFCLQVTSPNLIMKG